MRLLAALFVAAVGVAAAAFVADSGLLLLLSVLLLAASTIGVLATGIKTAQETDFVTPFLLILCGALGVAAVGVIAIVVGQRQDAPGLVLLGIAVIVSAIAAALTLGLRSAQIR